MLHRHGIHNNPYVATAAVRPSVLKTCTDFSTNRRMFNGADRAFVVSRQIDAG